MYFPVGWPKQLKVNYNDNTELHFLASSLDKLFVAVLSGKTIGIWFCKPNVELVSVKRSVECLKQHGNNQFLAWKPSSLLLAVVTSENFILFYRVEQNKQYPTCYEQLYSNNGIPEEGIPNLQSIPSLSLSLSHHIQIPGGVTSMVSLKEDLVLGTGRGLVQRVGWVDGRIKTRFTIELASVPFSTDLQQTRATPLNDSSVHVTHLEYSSLIGGFAVVLSNGRAAFLASSSLKFEPNHVVGVWAQEMCDVSCVAINHKFSLIAFADNSGDGTVYQMDEATGSLVISHKLAISSKDLPDARQRCGGVSLMKWSVDGAVVVMAWARGAFAVWSVFGSLLFHSTALHAGYNSSSLQNTFKITSMEWGCEGYHLWMIKEDNRKEKKKDDDNKDGKVGDHDNNDGDNKEKDKKETAKTVEDIKDSINNIPTSSSSSSKPPLPSFSSSSSSSHTIIPSSPSADEISLSAPQSSSSSSSSKLILFNFVKSSLFNNPFLGNQVHLLMQGEDKLYLNPEDGLADSSSTHQSCPSVVSNRQWHVLTPPPSYLANNWPIRYAAMSSSGNWLAAAGRRGFSHYSLLSRRWKMFGNETQESDMLVTGGLAWWKEFICVPCYNLLDQRDEIRLYNRESKLDNSLMSHRRTHSATTLTNVFLHLLITLSQDCTISIFALSRSRLPKSTEQADITLVQEINIDNFIPHPSNVLAVTLTSLRTDAGCEHTHGAEKQAESILINVAGRLLLFQRDRCLDNHQSPHNNWLAFTAPVVVASSVETMWLSWRCSHQKPHLTDALWLGCGASGLKVWLPLQLKEDTKSRRKGFLSKRIMLPFNADIYPLAMLFEAGIILGAMTESTPHQAPPSQSSPLLSPSFSYLLLERTSQIYLHHILRQLLRRNLGIHALEIARSCTGLVYFPHVLELLVHEVLEEESTSKEPIPDALLPRVVAFVEEFPEYLQTIAHCARKSDAAVWEGFFSVVGSPSDLFQNCLQSRELTTASSYLIILQNLETPSQARQHAIALLDAALDDSMWDLARDLVRYLSAIVNDAATTPATPTSATGGRKRQNSQSKYSGFYTPSTSSNVVDPFMHSGVIRARSLSKDEIQNFNKTVDSPVAVSKSRQLSSSTTTTHPTSISSPTMDQHGDKLDINMVLERHARKLMSTYALCSLARFAANLDDYHLVAWLRKERLSSARVDDFIAALKALHRDFQWPLPIIPIFQLPKLDSVGSLQMSSADTSLNDVSSTRSSLQSRFKRSTSMDASEEGTTSLPDKNSSDSSSSPANASDALIRAEVDKLCLDLLSISTGTPQANLQLRYLYQLLMEAECLEWALVVSVVLQDTCLFSRTVAAAYLPSTPHPTILRMLRGSQAFVAWSLIECPGYSSLVLSLKEDLMLLESVEKKVLATAASNKRTSLNLQQQHNNLEQQHNNVPQHSTQQQNTSQQLQHNNTQHLQLNLQQSHNLQQQQYNTQQQLLSESHAPTTNKESLNGDDDDVTKSTNQENVVNGDDGGGENDDDVIEEDNSKGMCSIS